MRDCAYDSKRILKTRIRKTFEAQPARIAQTARAALRVRIVATMRQPEIDAQLARLT